MRGWKLIAAVLLMIGACSLPPPARVRDQNYAKYFDKKLCDTEASEWFKRAWDDPRDPARSVSAYTAHSNSQDGLCFAVGASTRFVKNDKYPAGYTIRLKTFFDVTEGVSLGTFHQTSLQAKPDYCHVDSAPCQSEAEWDALAKPWMEN